jgi:hypothetical protein
MCVSGTSSRMLTARKSCAVPVTFISSATPKFKNISREPMSSNGAANLLHFRIASVKLAPKQEGKRQRQDAPRTRQDLVWIIRPRRPPVVGRPRNAKKVAIHVRQAAADPSVRALTCRMARGSAHALRGRGPRRWWSCARGPGSGRRRWRCHTGYRVSLGRRRARQGRGRGRSRTVGR